MNPDQVQELANNLADLRAAVNQLAGASSLMANSFQRSVQGLSQVDPAFRNAANSLRDSVENTRQAGNAVQAEQLAAAQMMKRNSAEQQYATQQLVSSLRTLSGGLASLNASMGNLNGAAGVLGGVIQKTALGLGANEQAAQSMKNAITGLGEDVLRQADSYNQLRSSLAKLGGAGEHTASSLYAYAKAAGLHMDSLNYMLAPLRALGTNILALGRGAGDAQKAFMEMLQVSRDQVDRFARLGIMQEELMARQSDFVAQTSSAGLSFRLMGTDMASLRKASTEYVRNLYDLSAITGESVDEQRNKQRAAVEERRLMMENLALQARATRLRKEANEAEALGTPEGRQEAEDKRRQAALLEKQASDQTRLIAALAKLPEETRVGIIQAMTTGGIGSEGAAMLARQGVLDDILKIVAEQKAARERGEETDPERDAMRIKEIIAGAGLENAEALKTAMQLGGEDLAKAFGYDIPGIQLARDYAGRDLTGELEQQRRRRAGAEEPEVDRTADVVAQLQRTSIELNKAYNDGIAALSPFIQAFDITTGKLVGIGNTLDKIGTLFTNALNKLISLGEFPSAVFDKYVDKFQGVPTEGGTSTISQRPPVPIITPPPPPPVEQVGTEPPVGQGPTATPLPPGQTEQAVTPQATPLPNYPAVTVETNKGNRLTLPSNGVAKIANLIKDGKNRDQLRQELLKYIGKNSGYDNVTLDKIIDKSAQAANLPIPAGSTVPTTAVTTAPTTAQPAAPEAQAPTMTPGAAPTVTPETAPTTTPEAQVPVTTTPVKPETTDSQRIPADIPAQQFTPSAELKTWIRSQIRRGVRRDKVREALLKQGYTAQQADAALTAELGNIPGTVQAQPAVVNQGAKPPQQATGQQAAPSGTSQGTQERPPAVAAPTVVARPPATPTDYNPETPEIDTVSPEQQNWLRVENDLRARLSDLVRNKKTLTRDQANQILDYYDTLRNKPGAMPTVDQIIQNSGVLTKPTTPAMQAPTTVGNVRPQTSSNTQQSRDRTSPDVSTQRSELGLEQRPAQSQGQGATAPTTAPTVEVKPRMQKMSLDQIAQEGLNKFIRGPQGKGRGKYDTHREGAELDSRVLSSAQKLSEIDLSPFSLQYITALNDEYHQRFNWKNNPHKEGRAIDFTLDKPPSAEDFEKLKPKLMAAGFDDIKDRYNNFNAGVDSGRHIHAEFNKLTSEGLAKGGLVSGSRSGFPALLHGSELVVPLDPNSILADLGKKSQEQIKTEMETITKSTSGEKFDPSIFRDISRQNQQIMEMIGYKLDNVINKLDMGNDTQSKILKYSQA